MTIKLNVLATLKAAAKARDEGRLGFQNPEVLEANEYRCLYRYPGTNVVCGVGAGVSDELYAAMQNANLEMATVDQLMRNVIEVDQPATLSILQQRHDSVVEAIEEQEDTEGKIADFNRFLDAKIAELEAA